MGHVLGLGTLFSYHGLAPNNVPCPYKSDSEASRRFRKISGCSGPIVLEESKGSGSNCGHWRDTCMKSERMSYNGGNYISEVSIGAMEDIGYEVNYGAADAFPASGWGSECQCNRRLRGNSTFTEEEEFEKPAPRRQLSEEGRAEAENAGRKMLMTRQNTRGRPSADFVDIGAHMVMVMYEEEGEIHSVMVQM